MKNYKMAGFRLALFLLFLNVVASLAYAWSAAPLVQPQPAKAKIGRVLAFRNLSGGQ